MKSIVLAVLILLGASLPVNAKFEVDDNKPSVLFWLDFHVAGDYDDEEDNNSVLPFALQEDANVIGFLYSDGQMELKFDNSDAVIVSINLNDSEVSSVEFIPTDGDRSLTFDLDDYGKGAYEVNVTMPDGSVQTATFEY